MSSPASSAPVRFACRVARRWSAVTGATGSRHAAACPDCQEYFRAAHALDAALRSEAMRAQPVMSTGFERRILNAVRASEVAADDLPARRGFRQLLPLASGALAVAAIAAIMLWANLASTRREIVSANDAQLVVRAVQSMSTQLVGSVLPSTGEFVANNPLQQEVDSLYADARSALGFLAMNFVPGRTEKARPSSG